ncbi:MAG: hypothetical protein Q8M24_24310 [Pseudolabrys sp.]|nr:hypothetical protein [Pseudolabrys sp.]MDP2298571.1 hypothetical protein [Pseudolabrys sp.]
MADILGGGAARGAALGARISNPRRAAVWTLASIGMMLLLLAPAIWNGFAIIFPDTGGYLDRPILGTLGLGRSALYGAFLYLGVPSHFWLNIVLQSAMTAWLIVLALRTHGLGGRPWLALGIVAFLTVATSMPWFAAQLMPDILFAAAALALHLLIFRDNALAHWERLALAAVIVLAMPSHMAAAGMCVGILIGVALLTRIRAFALPEARLTFAAGAVTAGLVLCPVSNYAITGNFALTPGGSSFVFGRLVEDGIVQRYLDEKCPDPALRLCAFTATFQSDADWWLWDGNSPFRKLQNFEGSAEEKAIIADTLKLYPAMHVLAALRATLDQLARFATEITGANNEPTIAMLKEHTPALFPQLMRARQQATPFGIAPINALHVPVAALAFVCLGAALLLRRRLGLPDELAALAVTVFLALAANAAICGAFSHAVDRYQSRLAWLAVLAAAMIAAWLYSRRSRTAAN